MTQFYMFRLPTKSQYHCSIRHQYRLHISRIGQIHISSGLLQLTKVDGHQYCDNGHHDHFYYLITLARL